jgi:hypothetical protein
MLSRRWPCLARAIRSKSWQFCTPLNSTRRSTLSFSIVHRRFAITIPGPGPPNGKMSLHGSSSHGSGGGSSDQSKRSGKYSSPRKRGVTCSNCGKVGRAPSTEYTCNSCRDLGAKRGHTVACSTALNAYDVTCNRCFERCEGCDCKGYTCTSCSMQFTANQSHQ